MGIMERFLPNDVDAFMDKMRGYRYSFTKKIIGGEKKQYEQGDGIQIIMRQMLLWMKLIL